MSSIEAPNCDVSPELYTAGSPCTYFNMQSLLSPDARVEERLVVARKVAAPPEVLGTLSRDRSKRVRGAVAANPSTPIAVLKKLAASELQRVRAAVASNRSAPPDVLDVLATENDLSIWWSVAGHPSAWPQTLRRLHERAVTGDGEGGGLEDYCMSLIAHNPATPQDVLECLVHASGYVASYLACNPSAPPGTLAKLLQCDYGEWTGLVRRLFARRLRAQAAADAWQPADYAPFLACDDEAVRLAALGALAQARV